MVFRPIDNYMNSEYSVHILIQITFLFFTFRRVALNSKTISVSLCVCVHCKALHMCKILNLSFVIVSHSNDNCLRVDSIFYEPYIKYADILTFLLLLLLLSPLQLLNVIDKFTNMHLLKATDNICSSINFGKN